MQFSVSNYGEPSSALRPKLGCSPSEILDKMQKFGTNLAWISNIDLWPNFKRKVGNIFKGKSEQARNSTCSQFGEEGVSWLETEYYLFYYVDFSGLITIHRYFLIIILIAMSSQNSYKNFNVLPKLPGNWLIVVKC